jgi:signal transduction histidine kinase
MVKDLESLARVEGDNLKLNKSEISLLEIASKVVNNQEKDIKNKSLSVEVKGENTKLLADGDRITQVVINLLSNAIKYTNNGGIIKIEIFEMEDYLGLSIQDNGIGIGKDDLPFIFERFYRTDKSRSHTTGGSGIGLAIVKSIVIAHGGKVNVDSEIDKGSRFTIKIPKI